MAIMKASKTLVCLVGESDVDFGMLKAKVRRPATTINPIMQWSSSAQTESLGCRYTPLWHG